MTDWTRSMLAPVLAGLLATAPAWGQASPTVAVTTAWSRATPPDAQIGAVYLTLTSPAGDKLLGVSSPLAKGAEVHEMTMDGNVMRMRGLPGGLELPAGESVTLQPGGYHIMLMGLRAPLKQGQTVPLHLTFQNSAPVDAQAQVAGIGAMGPPKAAMPR